MGNNNFQKFKKMPLFSSLAFLLSVCFVFLYLYTQIQKNNEVSRQLETTWQSEANKQEELKMLDQGLKITEGGRAALETHFIQSSDVVPFLDMVEKIAGEVETKAEISLVDLSKDNAELTVEMKATGHFEAVYKFLTLLENSPYELDFVSIDMQKSSGGDGSGKGALIPTWSATFKIKLLSFIK